MQDYDDWKVFQHKPRRDATIATEGNIVSVEPLSALPCSNHLMSHRRILLPRAEDCEPPDPVDTVTTRLNNLLQSSGAGYILRLCPGQKYLIQAPIVFTAPYQEISTLGYPTGNDRATLVVDGPVGNGTGHTNAVNGNCGNCSGVKLRNIQVHLSHHQFI